MSQIDIVATTKPVVEAFEMLGIPYSIGGSVASSTYGIARATMDVDIIAAIQLEHVGALVEQLRAAYYIDANMMTNAINRQSSFNLIHLETMWKVDIFILKDAPYYQAALQRRRIDTIENDPSATEFYFVTAEDIILSKLDWYRMGGGISQRQWKDVLGILKVQNQLLDFTYLEQWAASLQLSDLLQQAFDDAGVTSA